MSAAGRTLLVTGASGHLGRRVVELLLEAKKGVVIAATRHPEKIADLAARGAVVRRADFDEPSSLDAAFSGVARLLLVSTDALDRPGHRLEQHQRAIDAAARAAIEHVVYTSFSHPDADSPVVLAPDHLGTEEALVKSGLDYTALRDNLYVDNFLHSLPRAVASGKLVTAGAGGAAYVTREDCARVAAAVLASAVKGRTSLEITGPAVVDYAEIAALTSEITGRPVAHVPLDAPGLRAGLVASGMPPAVADLLVSFDVGMERGKFAPATAAVRELTGKAPTSVRAFFTAHRAALLGGSH